MCSNDYLGPTLICGDLYGLFYIKSGYMVDWLIISTCYALYCLLEHVLACVVCWIIHGMMYYDIFGSLFLLELPTLSIFGISCLFCVILLILTW